MNHQLSSGDGRWPSFTERAIEVGYHSVHSLPMQLRGRTVGALNMFRTDSGAFGEDDVIAAQALADVATIAIVQNHSAIDILVLNAQLTKALNSRVVIEQAKGMISEATGLEMGQAFKRLRTHVRTHGISLDVLSSGIAEGTVDPVSFGSQPRTRTTSDDKQIILPAAVPRVTTVTVCVVEDNRNLREQLVDLLTEANAEVIAAVGTMKEGERAIIAHLPDVAVIDHNLPDGTGVDLIRTLTGIAPQVTLLLYSATITDGDARKARKK